MGNCSGYSKATSSSLGCLLRLALLGALFVAHTTGQPTSVSLQVSEDVPARSDGLGDIYSDYVLELKGLINPFMENFKNFSLESNGSGQVLSNSVLRPFNLSTDKMWTLMCEIEGYIPWLQCAGDQLPELSDDADRLAGLIRTTVTLLRRELTPSQMCGDRARAFSTPQPDIRDTTPAPQSEVGTRNVRYCRLCGQRLRFTRVKRRKLPSVLDKMSRTVANLDSELKKQQDALY
ncbi:uncharacterized protein LOC110983406 [Acanthaster planci]|uniref:Uncharacterized protein LOC110983406 n=1 Tax=Acanthaster planci TaxID=133434 RepID=A0A8B7Z0N2_ACAPL|nr:uncharacterized protein LOC110983406 [Acanthaster planci]